MESQTVNKLSFPPICPPPKEPLPWARRAVYQPPSIRMESETTYKKSFLPNFEKRPLAVHPCDHLKIPAGVGIEGRTVYKESFLPSLGERPAPIRPKPQLKLPECSRMPQDTVYKVKREECPHHNCCFEWMLTG